ncbi:hypothetical protein [Haloterrigena alkaliphila]|uniref:hypothetical protein n=1 Tax=Haloterrigena alkaliphila TaxID=2816475 RepID=UPI001CECDA56|nr:hypothetical protein [Haloterrigena alkaliphila]UHQ95021.1 hypothetical protein J0X25_14745 [Haloterrigena alkaliphila]
MERRSASVGVQSVIGESQSTIDAGGPPHVFAGRFRFLEASPRSRWLSMAGGVSVAYVFVHHLSEIGTATASIDESGTALAAVDRHIYLVPLAGFVAFYDPSDSAAD